MAGRSSRRAARRDGAFHGADRRPHRHGSRRDLSGLPRQHHTDGVLTASHTRSPARSAQVTTRSAARPGPLLTAFVPVPNILGDTFGRGWSGIHDDRFHRSWMARSVTFGRTPSSTGCIPLTLRPAVQSRRDRGRPGGPCGAAGWVDQVLLNRRPARRGATASGQRPSATTRNCSPDGPSRPDASHVSEVARRALELVPAA